MAEKPKVGEVGQEGGVDWRGGKGEVADLGLWGFGMETCGSILVRKGLFI